MSLSDFDKKFVHATIIRKNHTFLLNNLNAKVDLLDHLYVSGVLLSDEHELIKSQKTSETQNQELLSVLKRKNKDHFDKFLEALDRTQQSYIRNRLDQQCRD